MSISFSTWIKRFSEEESPLGDLARDIVNDQDFPRRATRYRTIRNYLKSRHAADEAMEVFQVAWTKYQRQYPVYS